MQKHGLMGLAAFMGLSMLSVAARADEEKISVEDLPAAVRKAVKKKFPEAKIRGAAREAEGGKTTYEVELTVEGHAVDVALNAKGKIVEIEKEIPANKLPGSVKKRLAAKYPGARIEKAEEITKGEEGKVRYEVVLKAEVVFNAKGKVVQAKEEGEDEDDHEPAAKAKKKEKHEDEDDEDEDDKPAARKKEHRDDHEPAAKAKKKEKKDDDEDDEDDD